MKRLLSILLGLVLVFTMFPAFAFADETLSPLQDEHWTMTFNPNGGTVSSYTVDVQNGESTILPIAMKTDYTFDGWSDDLTIYEAGAVYTPTGDITLTAQWTPGQDPAGTDGSGTIVIDPPIEPIVEAETPMAAPEPEVTIQPLRPALANFSTWALLNLILTILTGLIMLFLLVSYFRKRKDETADGEEGPDLRFVLRLLTIAATAAAAVLFAATQDISHPIGLADRFTGWHFVILVVNVVLAILCINKAADKQEASEET